MSDRRPSTLVTLALLAAGIAANSLLVCGGNAVAFAAVGVFALGLRRGALVALAIWLEGQLLGFTALGFPHDALTIAWGAALGAATLLAATVAATFATRSRLAAAALAFVAYEVALAGFSVASGSGLSAFAPRVVGEILASNLVVGLAAAALAGGVRWAESARAGVASPRR